MKNHITDLKIENFKSIKKAELDCRRINLIVGKPNVGKSNLLEGISMLGDYHHTQDKAFKEVIRYNKYRELFYDTNFNDSIEINTNIGNVYCKKSNVRGTYTLIITTDESFKDNLNLLPESFQNYAKDKEIKNDSGIDHIYLTLDDSGKTLDNFHKFSEPQNPIKKYIFKQLGDKSVNSNSFGGHLSSPFGGNLFAIIESYPELRKAIAEKFKEYGLELLLDVSNETLEIQKRVNDYVYKIPFNLMADTLQRMIFNYAAIESNKDSILLFEEPETHSFPPYVYELAQKIVYDENQNQYFITTHSPFLFNTIVQEAKPEELSVFIATYQDYQTHFQRLSEDDLAELLNYGIDIFFNQKYFTNE